MIHLKDIWLTQRRVNLAKVCQLLKDMPFREKVVLAQCPDNEIEIKNGHHRLTALFFLGRTHLRMCEYTLVSVDKCSVRFGRLEDWCERYRVGV